MDDIYLAIAGCTAVAKRMNVSYQRILDLEEAVAKILSFRWSEYDVPGVVSW